MGRVSGGLRLAEEWDSLGRWLGTWLVDWDYE
jgi:hypothetical protein